MIPSFLKFHFQFLQFLFCLFVIPKYLIYVLRVIFHPFCSLSIRFALDHYFRKACIALSENKKFEYFILVTILATCVSLGYIITIIIIFKFFSVIIITIVIMLRIFLTIFAIPKCLHVTSCICLYTTQPPLHKNFESCHPMPRHEHSLPKQRQ